MAGNREVTQKVEDCDNGPSYLVQGKDMSLAASKPLEMAASTDTVMVTAASEEKKMSVHSTTGMLEHEPGIDEPFDNTVAPPVRDEVTNFQGVTPTNVESGVLDGSTFGKAMREAERADDLLIPPLNFGRVCRGVYRSGFPGKKNFTFLKKLKLHTVLNLSEHEYSKESIDFLSENRIECTHMPILGNREPMQSTDEALLCKALVQVLRATADR